MIYNNVGSKAPWKSIRLAKTGTMTIPSGRTEETEPLHIEPEELPFVVAQAIPVGEPAADLYWSTPTTQGVHFTIRRWLLEQAVSIIFANGYETGTIIAHYAIYFIRP